MNKALNLLGLARKGGRIELGDEAVGLACRQSKARLLILACDAGDSVTHRAQYFVRSGKPPLLRADHTKDEMGTAVGRNVCPIAAVTDVRLALAYVQALGEPERWQEILDVLEYGVKRADKRKAEEKAHQKNLRRGKK